jgi:hypothetical protein
MAEFEFQLIAPRGGDAFQHSRFEKLADALKSRLPLRDIRYEGKISEEDLGRSGGLAGGAPVPVFVVVTLNIDGEVSRKDARAQLQEAVAGLGRPDINVVNA